MTSIKCDGEKLPAQHRSAWFGFIKSIATFRGDLSSLSAPPFLLSPLSIVEFSSYWAEHPSLFIAPALEPSAEKRALLVLKWFLSTLKQQHSSRDEHGKKKRMKPLNPFLGEIFLGEWQDDVGTTNLVAEQVSHHPPVTVCNVWNDRYGVRLQGHVAPKVYFSSTVHIERKGYSILHIDKYNEDYLITMPKIHVEGLMTGHPTPELSGCSYIRSSAGYTIKIEYSFKGWIGGKRNGFVASLVRDENEKEVLYTAEGQWSDSWVVKEGGKAGKVMERFDVNEIPRTPLQVAPIDEQHPLESRRAWRHVADAIHKGDFFGVGHEKSKIENEQRELRKREKVVGAEFARRYFSRVEEDPVAERLAEGLSGETSLKGEMDGHHGLWMWDEDKYRRIHKVGSVNGNGDPVKRPTRMKFDSGIGGILMNEAESKEVID